MHNNFCAACFVLGLKRHKYFAFFIVAARTSPLAPNVMTSIIGFAFASVSYPVTSTYCNTVSWASSSTGEIWASATFFFTAQAIIKLHAPLIVATILIPVTFPYPAVSRRIIVIVRNAFICIWIPPALPIRTIAFCIFVDMGTCGFAIRLAIRLLVTVGIIEPFVDSPERLFGEH